MEWNEKYGCAHAELARGVIAEANYDKGGFTAQVTMYRARVLKEQFKSADDAKKAAIRLARQIAQEILDATKEEGYA